MKKVTLILAVLAFVGCRFDENGNKGVLPETIVEHDAHDDAQVEAHNDHAETAVVEETEELDASGNYVYDVGELQEITLADGTVLTVGSASTENKLFQMLSDEGFEVNSDKSQDWVTLDRVYFNTGSDELTPTSRAQIDNIVALLKAYPETEVKLGGYTDNTGSQEINQPLSEGRAKSVMGDINKSGIDSERLAAEGYGSEHPVCPENDTDVCKAKNRRVDIRITNK